jgi:protein-S-isoprenylcysteine O-methyltransferase Ste14
MRLFLMLPASLLALALAWLGVRTLPGNLLGWVLLAVGGGYLIGAPFLLFPRHSALLGGAEPPARAEAGNRSFWLVLPGFVAAFFAAPLEYSFLGGAARAGILSQGMGLALLLLGVALRVWTRRALRAGYTARVQVTPEHHLQTGGPYRFIRHPGYAGFVLMLLGLALGYGSLLSAAAIALLLLPALACRMRVEERLLAEQFGEAYRRYASRTKRLIPGIW